MSFTARRISTGEGKHAMPGDLVHRRTDIEQLEKIAKIADRARHAALAIERRARKQAKLRAARAAAIRRAREADADLAFVTRAQTLEAAYRHARILLTAQLEETLDRVLVASLTCIGVEIPVAQRLRIVSERLAREAGPVAAGRLRMCSADESAYRIAGLHSPWPIQIDDALAPGHCRLAMEHGEWALDFQTLVASLMPVPALHGATTPERSQA